MPEGEKCLGCQCGGQNVPPVGIGLTDLPKIWVASGNPGITSSGIPGLSMKFFDRQYVVD
jgi:hypothetical protein